MGHGSDPLEEPRGEPARSTTAPRREGTTDRASKTGAVPAEVRREIEEGLEFFLCSFVEMSGAPKAKLVPATHLEDMAAEGAGFAGFAAGEIGQGPHSPDIAAIPDFGQPDGPAVAARTSPGSRATSSWTASPGPTARARSCSGYLEEARGERLRLQDRRRAGVLPGPAGRRPVSCPCGPARHAGQAVLRPARAPPQPGL